MYLSGPSTANVGQTITVSASGAPDGTKQISFRADGNVGFDTVETSSGSASFRLELDFKGTTRITATAQDAYGNGLGSASHSISVVDPDFDTPAATPAVQPRVQTPLPRVSAPAAVAGEPWHMRLQNIGAAHSVLVEFYGANGGIYRLFPRNRNEMELALTFQYAGRTQIYTTLRNDSLAALSVLKVDVDVGAVRSQAMTGPSMLAMQPAGAVPVLGPHKPPFAALAGHQGPSVVAAASGTGDLSDMINAKTDALMSRLKKF